MKDPPERSKLCNSCKKPSALTDGECAICHFLKSDYEKQFYEDAADLVFNRTPDAYKYPPEYQADLIIQRLPYTQTFKSEHYPIIYRAVVSFLSSYLIKDSEIFSIRPQGKIYRNISKKVMMGNVVRSNSFICR